jgi:signal transduction histidine kinase
MTRSLDAIAAPSNQARLVWAVRVRWLVIAGFFFLALVGYATGLFPSLTPCAVAAAVATAVNAVNHLCLLRRRFIRTVTALAIPGDVFLITYLTIHTGGVQSPFVMMYVVQVVATAMLVDLAVAVFSAVASAVAFATAVAVQGTGSVGLQSVSAPAASNPAYAFVWALFLLYCLGLLAYVGGYISERLRSSERDLERRNQELGQALSSLEATHADLATAYGRLRAAESQLVQSEKMRALGQFVAGIAHELNNPIAFIGANIEHLKRTAEAMTKMLDLYSRSELPEPLRRELETEAKAIHLADLVDDLPSLVDDCQDGTRRATEIVAALRTFSHRERNEQWSLVDIHDCLDRTLALLRHRFGDGIRVERDYGSIPQVEGLRTQLDQVFLNLLANAVDAVGQRGQIRVSTELDPAPQVTPRPGPHVVVSVCDDGVGIPPEDQRSIFDPFFTTKEAGKGTGLGLSISFGIVERHGGTISLDSAPGAGATFRVYLPLERDKEHSGAESYT